VETAFSPRSTSLEGVWHQAVKTNWAWKWAFLFWAFYNMLYTGSRLLMVQYSSYHGYTVAEVIGLGLLMLVLTLLVILPLAYWTDQNKIVAMLRFDNAGIALQLKSGLVLEAGWNLVRRVKYDRWGKLSIIRLKGTSTPFTGQLPTEVHAGLAARLAGMRRGPPEPAGPTLEDEIDRRLAANARM
jgi:hypothetical protein